jgi:hypothetical protein
MRLNHLCTLELSFDEPLEQIRTRHRDGGLFGSGTGVVAGDALSGDICWTNHPRLRADGTTLPELHGLIHADDGAVVLLELRGVSTLLGDGISRDTRGAVTFTAPEGRHAWLNDLFCVCEGAYDVAREKGLFAIHRCLSDIAVAAA